MVHYGEDIFTDDSAKSTPFTLLAAAIVKRAFQDLCVTGERRAARVRKEAYEFLTEGLWSSSCVWRELLPDSVTRQSVMEAISKRVVVGRFGEITPAREHE